MLTPESEADAALDQFQIENMALVSERPHPRNYGGEILQMRNGPRWVIPNQASQLVYLRDLAAYWRKRASSEHAANE